MTPLALLLVAQVAAAEPPRQPIFEGWAGRYQSTSFRPTSGNQASLTTIAWQGMATLRTPALRGWRIAAAAETAPQPGQLVAGSFATWDGAEVTGILSYDGWTHEDWSLSPSVAVGGVFALGEDRQRVDVTPQLVAIGTRAEYRAGGASIRLYIGFGRHEAVSDEGLAIGDVFVRLPLLGDRLGFHARFYVNGESQVWRYGIVARWW